MIRAAAQRGLIWLQRIETYLLAALVIVLVALAGAQIVLRDFFDTGISWADPLMRSLVLWTGMLGALAAVRDDKHIALDVLQRYASPTAQRIARVVTLGFTAILCAAMAFYSYGLVAIDLAESAQTGAASAVPTWLPESILPIAFGLMALRFALRAFAPPAHPPVLLHDRGESPT
jgi:TRAP-type C4-dicarboxylate transport system permease small subunit